MPVVAKLTALAVTSIIVFGTDSDVLRAVPLGLFAGILTTVFVTLIDSLQAEEREPQSA
jgi:hypothetical protein